MALRDTSKLILRRLFQMQIDLRELDTVQYIKISQSIVSGNISFLQTRHTLILVLQVRAVLYESKDIDTILRIYKKEERKLE